VRIAQAARHKKALSALEKKGGGGAAAAAAVTADAAPAATGGGSAEKARLAKYGRSSESSDMALSESGEEFEDDGEENEDRLRTLVAEAVKVRGAAVLHWVTLAGPRGLRSLVSGWTSSCNGG
jgi:hypothetical protein